MKSYKTLPSRWERLSILMLQAIILPRYYKSSDLNHPCLILVVSAKIVVWGMEKGRGQSLAGGGRSPQISSVVQWKDRKRSVFRRKFFTRGRVKQSQVILRNAPWHGSLTVGIYHFSGCFLPCFWPRQTNCFSKNSQAQFRIYGTIFNREFACSCPGFEGQRV